MRKRFSARIKRLKTWLSEHKALVTGLSMAVLIGTFSVLSTNNVTTTITALPLKDQLRASAVDTRDYEPSNKEKIAGVLPTKEVTLTQFRKLMSVEAKANRSGDAYLNSTTNAAATVVYEDDNPTRIITTHFLANDAKEIIKLIESTGRQVSIISSSTSSSPSIYSSEVTARGMMGSTASLQRDLSTAPPTTARATSEDSGAGVAARAVVDNTLNVFGYIFRTLFYLAIIWLIWRSWKSISATRKMTRQPVGAGRGANGSLAENEIPKTKFSDVAGCDEAIEDMKELVDFLKTPEKYTAVGAVPPRGALLIGPPGTGKTLLAKAVAGEANVPFFSVAGSDFAEMYVGVGPSRVRSLFKKARECEEGAIIFIDEIDGIGRKRSGGEGGGGGNAEMENTLNALLVEMDGFKESKVIVMGATNRSDLLDPALTRPGRLDRKIQVPLPDRLGREQILKVHATNKPLTSDVDLNLVARRTPGMSGAELAQIINEACLIAARESRSEVTNTDLDAAVATVAMGKARTSAVVTQHDRTITAWHEAGHTVAAMVLDDADKPVSVSIIPRGPAGGVTWMAIGDDLFLTRKRALARLVVALAGRAGEEILLDGEFTSGPHGDLAAASETALAMVTKYGMTEAGLMIKSDGLLATGAQTTNETVKAVENLLADALEIARETLASHRGLLTAVAESLLENDTLTASQLQELKSQFESVSPKLADAPKVYRRQSVFPKAEEPTVPAAQSEPTEVFEPIAEPKPAEKPRLRLRKRTKAERAVHAFQAAYGAWREIKPKKNKGF